MAIKKLSKAIGESKQRKMITACKKVGYKTSKKLETARKKLRKKTWGF
jgi:hypothetical protein